MADKLSVSQLKQLERAQERWLALRDEYPRCWHCCACQTGPVEVRGTHRIGDAVPEDKTLGYLKTVILGSDFPTNRQVEFIRDEPTITLPDRRMQSLQMSVWSEVFAPIIQTSICPSSLRFFTEAKRLPSEDALPWFGRLNLSESWNWAPTEPRFDFELPVEFEELANDSITASRIPRTRPDLRLTALDRWLATTYDLLAVASSKPQSHSIWVGFIRGTTGLIREADWFAIGKKKFFVPANEELDLTAIVPLKERHLPADICTASAMAIDTLIMATSEGSKPSVQTTESRKRKVALPRKPGRKPQVDTGMTHEVEDDLYAKWLDEWDGARRKIAFAKAQHPIPAPIVLAALKHAENRRAKRMKKRK